MDTQSKSFKKALLACCGLLVVLVLIIVHMMGGGEQANFRSAIQSALSQDATTASGVTSVAEVVGRMRAIDTSGCPNDFRVAYVTHIQAWEGMAAVEQQAIRFKQDNETIWPYVEAFIRGVMMDPFGKVREIRAAHSELERQAQASGEQIHSTFNQVERIAVAYGATLPRR